MSGMHGLPRLGITGVGSLGVFRENQDAIDVLRIHFSSCHSLLEIGHTFWVLDSATRLGVIGYATILVVSVFTGYKLVKFKSADWMHEKAFAMVETHRMQIERQIASSKKVAAKH